MFEWTPDKPLSWDEPARVRHYFYPQNYLKSWRPAAITAAMVAVWFVLWLIIPRRGSAIIDLLGCLALGLVFGGLLGYGLGALLHIGPTTINVDLEGVERVNPIAMHLFHFGFVGLILMALGKGRKRWSWKQIHGYQLASYEIRGKPCDVIEFLNIQGEILVRAGLAKKLKRDRLFQLLEFRQCLFLGLETPNVAP